MKLADEALKRKYSDSKKRPHEKGVGASVAKRISPVKKGRKRRLWDNSDDAAFKYGARNLRFVGNRENVVIPQRMAPPTAETPAVDIVIDLGKTTEEARPKTGRKRSEERPVPPRERSETPREGRRRRSETRRDDRSAEERIFDEIYSDTGVADGFTAVDRRKMIAVCVVFCLALLVGLIATVWWLILGKGAIFSTAVPILLATSTMLFVLSGVMYTMFVKDKSGRFSEFVKAIRTKARGAIVTFLSSLALVAVGTVILYFGQSFTNISFSAGLSLALTLCGVGFGIYSLVLYEIVNKNRRRVRGRLVKAVCVGGYVAVPLLIVAIGWGSYLGLTLLFKYFFVIV